MKNYFESPIHTYFSLSYAQYLAIPRSVLQSMPLKWQEKFVQLLEELDKTIDWRPQDNTCYHVTLRELQEEYDEDEKQYITEWGNQLEDPLADYQRGRRQISLKNKLLES